MSLLISMCSPDFAVFCTDEISYGPNAAGLRRSSKVTPLTHIDSMVASTGLCAASDLFEYLVGSEGPQSYDELVDVAAKAMPAIWHKVTEDRDAWGDDAYLVLNLAGWSPSRQRFAGHVLKSPDFHLVERPEYGLSVVPAPETHTPPADLTIDDVVNLAIAIRDDQLLRHRNDAKGGDGRILIGGRLRYRLLVRGSYSDTVIADFGDTPELWAKYLDGLTTIDIDHESRWMERTG